MLKKYASVVLTSFRSSTYPRGYASGSSLAAALLDKLFEHPAASFLYSRNKYLDQGGIESFALLFPGPAKDDNRHTEHGDSGSSPVKDGELLAVHDP